MGLYIAEIRTWGYVRGVVLPPSQKNLETINFQGTSRSCEIGNI
jgi:hypothetical protein